MNPYQYECTCDVCGEPGMAHIRHAGMDWIVGNTFTHKDPRVCADNLRWKREREEAQKNQGEPCPSI